MTTIAFKVHCDFAYATFDHVTHRNAYTEMDLYTMREFERLSKEEPDAHVMPCKGIQYCEDPALPGEDPHWVRKIYKNVSIKDPMSFPAVS